MMPDEFLLQVLAPAFDGNPHVVETKPLSSKEGQESWLVFTKDDGSVVVTVETQ